MDVGDARTIGRRLYQIRNSRRKSLRVVAGLAGMSTTQLWRIEHGERALDSISETVALADALQIAPSELMRICGSTANPTGPRSPTPTWPSRTRSAQCWQPSGPGTRCSARSAAAL